MRRHAILLLNFLMAALASGILGLALFGILRPAPARAGGTPEETADPAGTAPQAGTESEDGAAEDETEPEAAPGAPDLTEAQLEGLTALYDAIASGDEAALAAAVPEWEAACRSMEDAGGLPAGELAWDGGAFRTGYSGTGMLFWEESVYWGEILEGLPNGQGRCLTWEGTWYDGSVAYLLLEGRFERGTAVGGAILRHRGTGGAAAQVSWDIAGTLDGTDREVITDGEVTVSCRIADGPAQGEHRFALSIRDGYLDQSEMGSAYESMTAPCSLHGECGVSIFADWTVLGTQCRNPWPWGREQSYERPGEEFMYFTYGWEAR